MEQKSDHAEILNTEHKHDTKISNPEQFVSNLEKEPHLKGLTDYQISILNSEKLKQLYSQCDEITWKLFLTEIEMSHSKNQWKRIRNRLGKKLHMKRKKKEIKARKQEMQELVKQSNGKTNEGNKRNEMKHDEAFKKKKPSRWSIQLNHLFLKRKMLDTKSWDDRYCIAIDCAFDEKMTAMELRSLASQMALTYSANSKVKDEPWYMIISGLNGALKDVMTGMRIEFNNWSVDVSEYPFFETLCKTQQLFSFRQSLPPLGTSTITLETSQCNAQESMTHNSIPSQDSSKNTHKDGIRCSINEEFRKKLESRSNLEKEFLSAPIDTFEKNETHPSLDSIKKRIIYLTADSPNKLETLEKGKIYVIGGIVDRNRHKGLCFERATELGIGHARFPIDEFLGPDRLSSTVITVNQCFELMQEARVQHSWKKALDVVFPSRKRKNGSTQDEIEEYRRVKKLRKEESLKNDEANELN